MLEVGRSAMNGTTIGSANQNTVESLKVFLQEMTTTIQNLAIRQSRVQFSNADSHMAFSSSQDNRMCVNTWHHADNEIMNGFVRHSGTSLPDRCRYDSQDLMVPQTDCTRMSPAVSTNGGYLGYLHQGLYGTQVNNMMDTGLNAKVVQRTWHPEKPPLDAQEYQCFVEEIKKTVQTWSAKHHSLVEASQSTSRNCEAPAPCSGISCLEPSWDSVLESSSHSQEEDVRAGNSSRGTTCSAPLREHASESAAADSLVVPLTSCKESQFLESASVFTKTSRRSNLYRRRALKKVENFCSDSTEVDASSPLNSKGTESPSTSQGFGPIVESPDWLPQGWLTEMKTRASGTSAGCKYKCYVDPITKRRFRTRKEVFCFLTTGNTGRYKPKSKVQQSVEHQHSGSIKHPVSGLQNILQGPNLAGGSHVNGPTFLQRSWQYHTGRSAYGGMVNIQAAALRLLTDDDDMTLDEKARLFARFSPRPADLYGLRLPTKNFKRMKAQGKEGLEALGKVICQQGLSILRKCND